MNKNNIFFVWLEIIEGMIHPFIFCTFLEHTCPHQDLSSPQIAQMGGIVGGVCKGDILSLRQEFKGRGYALYKVRVKMRVR